VTYEETGVQTDAIPTVLAMITIDERSGESNVNERMTLERLIKHIIEDLKLISQGVHHTFLN
jgi:hypothetical protein